MVMKCTLRNIWISLFLVLGLNLNAQDLKLNELDSIVALAVDAKTNFFVADQANTLFKVSSKGETITQVNTKLYGEISKIDCSNPFEVYTYHKDQNLIVYYDNMLNIKGLTRLNDIYLGNVQAAARSFDNNLWVWDVGEFKLKKVSKLGKELLSSPNLLNVLNKDLAIINVYEENGKVHLVDTLNGVHQFDLFATHITTHYHHKSFSEAISYPNYYIFKSGEDLYLYHKFSRALFKKYIVPKNLSIVSFDGNLVSGFYGNTIMTYKLQ